jgi:glycosyltransferase involved in cell wall biosynthesis
MKKIMFFFPLIYIGGTEVAILSLIKKLKGFDIYIGYVNENSDRGMLEEFSKYATVVNVEKEKDIEVDYFISCSMKLHLCDAANNVKRKKTILWVHQVLNLPDSILNTTLRNSLDYVVTVSNTICDLLKDTFKDIKDKIKSIYNVIDSDLVIDKASEEYELELSEQLNLVTVSRVCRDKGFSRMLELAKYLRESNVDFKWFIIGDNFNKVEANEIMESFADFKDNFVWLGFLDNPHKIVKQCDYSVLLSSNETWGLVLTEAMCLGVPCISTDFEVVFEQIRDKENGIILSREDTTSYKDRIKDIIKNKKKYKKAIMNFKYDNDSILKAWEELLEAVQM